MQPNVPVETVEEPSGAPQSLSERRPLPKIRFSFGGPPRIVIKNLKPPTSGVNIVAPQTIKLESESTGQKVPLEKDNSATDTDEDGQLIQKVLKAKDEMLKRQAHMRQLPAKRRRVNSTKSPGVTLKALLDENLIASGDNMLSLEYRGKTERASVDPEGKIEWKGMKFDSPSSFSIHVKRLVNPSRKADDGWKTVKYNGRFLENYKLDLAKRRFNQSLTEAHSASTTSEPSPQATRLSNPNSKVERAMIDTSVDSKNDLPSLHPQAPHIPEVAPQRVHFFCSS